LHSLIREKGLALSFQRADMEKAVAHVIEDYICSEFELKYDRLSGELFDIRREITSNLKDNYGYTKDVNITIPLFARANLGEETWKLEEARDKDNRTYDIKVFSKVPPITREVKEKAKQAEIDYMNIISRALKQQLIGDFIFGDLDTLEGTLNLKTCWVPKPSELKINIEERVKDPFLIGCLYGRTYLITTWDIEGEEPYEHYVREFTEKKAS